MNFLGLNYGRSEYNHDAYMVAKGLKSQSDYKFTESAQIAKAWNSVCIWSAAGLPVCPP